MWKLEDEPKKPPRSVDAEHPGLQRAQAMPLSNLRTIFAWDRNGYVNFGVRDNDAERGKKRRD